MAVVTDEPDKFRIAERRLEALREETHALNEGADRLLDSISRDRQQTDELVRLLLKFYTREEAFLWLISPQPLFDSAIPLDMIAAGRVSDLVVSLRQMDEGVYS